MAHLKNTARMLSVAFLAAALVVPAFVPGEAQAKKAAEYVTIGTGGITGVYYPVGGAICRMVNKTSKENGIRCTVEATDASVFNANALRAGDLSMGIVQSDTQYYAYTGTGTPVFEKAGPDKNLRALFSLHAEAFTLVARDDANINNFDDLAGKRMNLGAPGTGNRSTLELLMKEYGWTERTFKLATDLKPAEMAGALCDDKIDAFVYVVGHPNASIKEAATTCSSHVVPVTGAKVEGFMKKYPFYPSAAIPGGEYKGTDKDVKTFGPRATLLTNTELSDDIAYLVVKTVFDNFEDFKKLHPTLSTLTKEEMLTGNSVPFHPGAEKYFKEAGLMK